MPEKKMSTQSIEEQHELTQKFCRLCLSEEMLEDVFKFKQDDIIRRISDLLSIEVSEDDRISRSICAICRARLHEFHDYKLSCLEVQDVLRGQICPAEEKDLSAKVFEQIKFEPQDDLDTEEDLLEEMKISLENTEVDAKVVEIVQIEKHVRNCSVRRKNPLKSKKKRYTYKSKKNYVTCRTCRKQVPKSGLEAHREEKHIPNYKCDHGCVGMKFECRQTQLQHHADVHNVRPKKCKICHKLFGAKSSLQYHTMSVHQLKRYHCVICKSSYPIKYLLDKHMKVHSANFDYNCSICGYATNIKFNLNRHMVVHAKMKVHAE